MNFRALALGATIGFLAAVVPSCSGSKCGPATCNGCCDATGKCVTTPANTTNTTCGAAGRTCEDCAAKSQVCNSATFMCGTSGAGGGSATGGGTAMAGGSGTGGMSGGMTGMMCGGVQCIAGCCSASMSCLPYSGQTANSCGDNGAMCARCNAGEVCRMGRCQPSVTTPPQIGDSCMVDADCAALGGNFKCKTMTTSGNASYPGGYCTKICTMDTECTSPTADGGTNNNGWCIGLNPAYGEGDRFCWKKCSGANGPCRAPDYACYNLGTTAQGTPVTACWLSTIPAVDAGPPSDKIGNPCMTNDQCSNPPDPAYGVCLLEFFIQADGGSTGRPTGYTGGYCSANCNITDAVCGAEGLCLTNFISSAGQGIDGCAKKCPLAWSGQTTACRPEYVCEGFVFLLADGGVQPAPADAGGFCSPSCFADGGECGNAALYCDAGYCVPTPPFVDAGTPDAGTPDAGSDPDAGEADAGDGG